MTRLLLGLFIFFVPSIVFAQWPALNDVPKVKSTTTNDVAVIVAIEDYLLLPDVEGAIANANEWENFFENALEVPSVHVLANQDATKEEMLKFAKLAAQDVGENGRIWWVFIGHGAPSVDGKDGMLVGMDAQQTVESLSSRSLSQAQLFKNLEATKNESVIVIDACFSGRSKDGKALAKAVQPVIAIDPTQGIGAKSVVFSAAKSTQVAGSLDGAKRPAFSYLMLGALRGWASSGDSEVTAKEALSYARRQLRGVKGREQTPQMTGSFKLVLSRGVSEKEPKAIQNGVEAADCPDGFNRVGGECKEVKKAATAKQSEAEQTLEYLQRRIVWDNRIARQAGRILEGPEFYHAINRPDLADKWMSHNPWLWVSGIGVVAAGVTLFVVGILNTVADGPNRSAWFAGGTLGGFLTIGGGVTMIVFGFISDKNPMSFRERKSAVAGFNKKERESRGLGPEVDWQNEQPKSKRSLFNPFGSLMIETPKIGVTIRF